MLFFHSSAGLRWPSHSFRTGNADFETLFPCFGPPSFCDLDWQTWFPKSYLDRSGKRDCPIDAVSDCISWNSVAEKCIPIWHWCLWRLKFFFPYGFWFLVPFLASSFVPWPHFVNEKSNVNQAASCRLNFRLVSLFSSSPRDFPTTTRRRNMTYFFFCHPRQKCLILGLRFQVNRELTHFFVVYLKTHIECENDSQTITSVPLLRPAGFVSDVPEPRTTRTYSCYEGE